MTLTDAVKRPEETSLQRLIPDKARINFTTDVAGLHWFLLATGSLFEELATVPEIVRTSHIGEELAWYAGTVGVNIRYESSR